MTNPVFLGTSGQQPDGLPGGIRGCKREIGHRLPHQRCLTQDLGGALPGGEKLEPHRGQRRFDEIQIEVCSWALAGMDRP
jgi:hypothetical protein